MSWRWDRPYRWPWLRWLFLLVWRIRERDVLDARETTGGGGPDYKHGKVTGQVPDLRVITETTESPWVCCGYCSAAMASWTAVKGLAPKLNGTAHPIRSQGGRPHDNGSRASELRDGAKRAHGVELDALAVDEIRDVLRDGFAVVVNLDYDQLPGYLRNQSGSFGHSCTLQGIRDGGDLVGFFDPLWPQDARGAWARWDDIRDALWGDGEHSGTTTRWGDPDPGPGPPDPEPPDPEPPDPEPPAPDLSELVELIVQLIARVQLERDRAWRATEGLDQPRIAGTWEPVDTARPVSWSRFARWGPELPAGSWSGPLASWSSGASWR